MKTITLLYSCDVHHSHDSRFLHGAFSTVGSAVGSLHELLAKADPEGGYTPLSQEQEYLLYRIGQTQGYDGPGEWILQTLKVDELDVVL